MALNRIPDLLISASSTNYRFHNLNPKTNAINRLINLSIDRAPRALEVELQLEIAFSTL